MAALKVVEGSLTYIITYEVLVFILDKMHIRIGNVLAWSKLITFLFLIQRLLIFPTN